MRGRRPGRPTKWLKATVQESVRVGRTGIQFEVWTKWKKKDRKLGTLTVSVGGLRWRPDAATRYRRTTWNELESWFAEREEVRRRDAARRAGRLARARRQRREQRTRRMRRLRRAELARRRARKAARRVRLRGQGRLRRPRS